MEYNNLNISQDSFLESFEKIRKSMMPFTKTLSEMVFDTSALSEAVGCISNSVVGLRKVYENIDMSKFSLEALKAANTHLEITKACKQSMKSFDEMGKLFSTKSVMEEYKNSLDNFRNISKLLMPISTIDTINSIQKIQESMKCFTDGILSEQISQLKRIDYGKIFYETLESNGTFKEAVDVAYDSLKEEKSTFKNIELEIDFESEHEIQEAINDQFNNPVSFQKRILNWADEKLKKYFIALHLFGFIINIFIMPYLQNWGCTVTTKVVSNVKELPQKGAEVICQLKENVEATIIENTNYYYKVVFTDENGVEREGYVAKRNLKVMEKSKDETEEEKLTLKIEGVCK